MEFSTMNGANPICN